MLALQNKDTQAKGRQQIQTFKKQLRSRNYSILLV